MYMSPLKPRRDDRASELDVRPSNAPRKNTNAALLLAVTAVTAFSLIATINHGIVWLPQDQAPAADR